jgi:hypothetical protein
MYDKINVLYNFYMRKNRLVHAYTCNCVILYAEEISALMQQEMSFIGV